VDLKIESDDLDYFLVRAEQEIERAQSADHPGVVRAHYLMAGMYLDLVYHDPVATACPPDARQSE
jgi:hypothetical protein